MRTIMRRYLRLLWLGLVLAAGNAHAIFHLWTMTELYSNADGSVQFLELRALAGGQQFLADHTLTAASGGVTHAFVFPADLPGDTSGHTMLIGTQGFAALGVVTPDYIVPNGFFFQNGGRISFAEGADVWDHGAVPGGALSLNRNSSTGTNSPQNFAGRTGSVPASTTSSFNVQGLWWNSNEAGWGVNLAHQSDTLFMSWFTYDTDGSGMWMFMSSAQKTAANTYGGALYRSTGAPFSAYDPTRFNFSQVGTATFTFSDANTGNFSYTIGSLAQTKPITRFVVEPGAAAVTCTQGGTYGANPNFSDLWWKQPAGSEGGWGINLAHQNNTIFLSWFTYGNEGRGIWYYASNMTRVPGSSTFNGQLFQTTGPAYNGPFSAAPVVPLPVGTATLSFTDAETGTFSYIVNGITQSKTVVRDIFQPAPSICR